LIEDLRALVEFATRAPSPVQPIDYSDTLGITRKCRGWSGLVPNCSTASVKPPRLNSLGSKVLEQARDLLQRTEALNLSRRATAEPHGLLRMGWPRPAEDADRTRNQGESLSFPPSP